MQRDFLGCEIISGEMKDIYERDTDWQPLKNQTILITGASGMLASYMTFFLIYLNENYGYNMNIITQVRNRDKMKNILGRYSEKQYLKIITDNVCEPFAVSECADYIMHAASLAGPQYYESSPIEVALPNAVGTYHLLEYAYGQKCKGFLYFSSGDIYGKMPPGTDISENMSGQVNPLDSHSCYGESKRMGETWCMAFSRQKNVPAKIVRIGHTYGPTMDINNDPRVFASFMKNIFYGEDIIMYSDGKAKRPFCYIADATAAFLTVLLYGENGEAYNVCNTEEFLSINELAQILVKLKSDRNLKVVYKTRVSSDSYLDNKVNRANKPVEDKLKKLGWKAHFNTEQGFFNTLKYLEYMEQK